MLEASLFIYRIAQHERAMADLYEAFAHALPNEAGFWKQLVAEEKAHGQVLMDLRDLLAGDDVSFDHDVISLDEVNVSREEILEQMDNVRKNGITFEKSLKMALRTECTIIERHFFRVFKTDDPKIAKDFDELREHTIEHIGRIKSKLRDSTPRITDMTGEVKQDDKGMGLAERLNQKKRKLPGQ